MMIDPLAENECREIIKRATSGRLGCALDNQPYVVPIYFAHESDYLYVFSTFGKKIEWMRANPKVCVQVEESGGDFDWVSVIANGTYEELAVPQFEAEVARARKLLEKRHHWWLNATAERSAQAGSELIESLYFRIRIESVMGLKGKSKDGKGR